MKVMVLVKASPESEAGAMPEQALLAAMGRFNEELVEAGILLSGEGLHPSAKAVRVSFSGGDRAVAKGPFGAPEDLVAGYWLWRVRSMDEAIEWVMRCPNPHAGESVIEIRPVFESDDFGEAFTPELRDRERRIAERLATEHGAKT